MPCEPACFCVNKAHAAGVRADLGLPQVNNDPDMGSDSKNCYFFNEKWGVDQVNSQEVILMFSYKIIKTNKNRNLHEN